MMHWIELIKPEPSRRFKVIGNKDLVHAGFGHGNLLSPSDGLDRDALGAAGGRRDALASATSAEAKDEHRQQILALLEAESKLARKLHALTLADSRLGFEASNHYFYVPGDLIEKVINCDHLRQQFK